VKALVINDRRDISEWIGIAEALGVEALHFDALFSFTRNAAGQLAALTVTGASDRHATALPGLLPAGVADSIRFEGPPLPPETAAALRAKVGAVVRRERAEGELPALDRVSAMTWLDDAQLALSTEGQLLIVDAGGARARVVREFAGERALALATHAGGRALLAGRFTELQSLDPQTGDVRFSIKTKWCNSPLLQFSADGRRVSRGKFGVFDLDAARELDAPRGAKDDTRTADDRFWIRWGGAKAPYEVRWPGQREGVPLEDGLTFSGLVVLGDALIARTPAGLVKWDAVTGKKLRTVPCEEGERARVLVTPNAPQTRLLTDVGSFALVVALPELKEVARVALPGPAQLLALSPSGARIAAVCDAKLHVLEVT
jgi:hypothetical protein